MTHDLKNSISFRNVPDMLNQLTGLFWTALIQHRAHQAVIASLGLERLAAEFERRIADEPETIRKLLTRILDIGGEPEFAISTYSIGKTLSDVLAFDLTAQEAGLPVLNAAAEYAAAHHDTATRRLIEDMIIDEEEHLAWLRNESELLRKMGEALYYAGRT